MSMQPNMGKMDAGIRYIVGFALLFVVILAEGPWRWVGLLGIIPIVTAVMTWCPLYRVLGIDTRDRQQGPTSKSL